MKGRILVVDDDPGIVGVLTECLSFLGYDVLGTSDPRRAMELFESHDPDVCVFDYVMPELSGAQLLDLVKKRDATVEVIFMTSEDQTRLAVEMMKKGAVDYQLKPVDVRRLELSVSRAFDHRRLVTENDNYRKHLERLVAERTEALKLALGRLENLHGATLDTLAMALDFRDQGTSGHSRRVSNWTSGAARMLGFEGETLVQIQHGALLHDVGKLKVPDSILWKPGKLNAEEWIIMKRHAEFGYEFLRGIDFLKDAAEIVYAHHEKFDGTGYPRGLKGHDIPFGSRLFMIVDSIDAMIYDRPYHRAIPFEDAAKEVRRCSGTQFDPELIEPVLDYLARQVPPKRLARTPGETVTAPIGGEIYAL